MTMALKRLLDTRLVTGERRHGNDRQRQHRSPEVFLSLPKRVAAVVVVVFVDVDNDDLAPLVSFSDVSNQIPGGGVSRDGGDGHLGTQLVLVLLGRVRSVAHV